MNNEINYEEARFEKIIEKAYKKIIGMPVFYEELLKANLYYLTQHVETPRFDENGKIIVSLSIIKGQNDEPILPIFTSIKEVMKMNWRNIDICSQTGENILKQFSYMKLLLNPNSPYSKLFLQQEIESLLNGKLLSKKSEIMIEQGTQFKFVQPKKFPKKFCFILSQIMRNNPEIIKSYLAFILDENTKRGFRVMIAMDITCPLQQIVPVLFSALKTYNLLSEDMDVIDFTSYGDLSGTVLKYFQTLSPFYDKEKYHE